MSIRQAFQLQADACRELGSPFMARLLTALPPVLQQGGEVADVVLIWPGDATYRGDSVPLRLAGGLHALVLTNQSDVLKSVYPPKPEVSDETFSAALSSALVAHSDFLLDWLTSPPQTNEPARAAILVAAGRLITHRFGLPLRLLELGASAGLNLRWDRVTLKLDGNRFGPQDAGLTLSPGWTGPLPTGKDIVVASRAGVDINPLDATDAADQLRLMSYLWPDQPDRLRRMKQALELAVTCPAKITKADAIDWLEKQLSKTITGATTVIYHTIAWQYFPAEVQARGKILIEQAGAKSAEDAPLIWLSMEADDNTPGAAISMRLWPGDTSVDLGRADFHGRWLDWCAPSLSE